jgi:hypothetical protein
MNDGVGCGLIGPLRARGDRWLQKAEIELPAAKASVQNAPSVKEQVQNATADRRNSSSTTRGATRPSQPYGSGEYTL